MRLFQPYLSRSSQHMNMMSIKPCFSYLLTWIRVGLHADNHSLPPPSSPPPLPPSPPKKSAGTKSKQTYKFKSSRRAKAFFNAEIIHKHICFILPYPESNN